MIKILPFLFAYILISSLSRAQVSINSMLDASFGRNGRALYYDSTIIIDVTVRFNVQKLAMQGNKIIVAGSCVNGVRSIVQSDSTKIVRLNEDGSLDRTFAKNGWLTFAYPHLASANILGLGCQTDGKIIGLFYTGTYYEEQSDPIFIDALFRLNADGTFDSSFGTHGFRKVNLYQKAMLLLPGNEIITAATKIFEHKRGYLLTKYTADGMFVTSDSIELPEKLLIPYVPTVKLKMAGNNKILLIGEQQKNGRSKNILSMYRYNFSLIRDSSFGSDGNFSYEITDVNDWDPYYAEDAAVQKNEAITASFYNSDGHRLIRIKNEGTIDSSFGLNGVITYPYRDNKIFYITELQTQNDDKILALLSTRVSGLALLRFTASGDIDSSFGKNGLSYTLMNIPGQNTRAYGNNMILQQDGKILVGGDAQYMSYNRTDGSPFVARYLAEKTFLKPSAPAITAASFKTKQSGITIAPNPVKDILQIKGLYKNGKSMLSIMDGNGTILLNAVTTGEIYTWHLPKLTAGIYYLRINNNKEIETLKFVKE